MFQNSSNAWLGGCSAKVCLQTAHPPLLQWYPTIDSCYPCYVACTFAHSLGCTPSVSDSEPRASSSS